MKDDFEIDIEWGEGDDDDNSDIAFVEGEGIIETHTISTDTLPRTPTGLIETYQEMGLRASFQTIAGGCVMYSPGPGFIAPNGAMLITYDTFK